MKILIIDDMEMVINAIAGIISDEIDCEILKATNGIEGIRIFKADNPDVIITDTEMPGMSGVEVIRTIKKERPDAKIILKSANIKNKDLADNEGVLFYWFDKYYDIIRLLKE